MRSTRKGGVRGPFLSALAASVGIHIAILIFLVIGMRGLPSGPEGSAVEIRLVGDRVHRPRRGVSRPKPPQPSGQTRAAYPVSPAQTYAGPAAPPSATPFVDLPESLRRALRASVGCDSPDAARLSPREREACRQHRSVIGRGGPTYAVEPADPVKAAAFDRAAADIERHRRDREGPVPNPPCVAVWCPPCKGASCAEPLRSTFAR